MGELWSAHILDASLTKIVRDATARMCPLAYVAQARCSMNAHFLSFTCAMRKVLKSMATWRAFTAGPALAQGRRTHPHRISVRPCLPGARHVAEGRAFSASSQTVIHTQSIDRSIDRSERSIRCALCLKVPWQLEAAAEVRASLWNKSSVVVGPDMQVGALLVPHADQSSRLTVRASTTQVRAGLVLCCDLPSQGRDCDRQLGMHKCKQLF